MNIKQRVFQLVGLGLSLCSASALMAVDKFTVDVVVLECQTPQIAEALRLGLEDRIREDSLGQGGALTHLGEQAQLSASVRLHTTESKPCSITLTNGKEEALAEEGGDESTIVICPTHVGENLSVELSYTREVMAEEKGAEGEPFQTFEGEEFMTREIVKPSGKGEFFYAFKIQDQKNDGQQGLSENHVVFVTCRASE